MTLGLAVLLALVAGPCDPPAPTGVSRRTKPGASSLEPLEAGGEGIAKACPLL